MPKKEDINSKKNKKGGCNCDKTLFSGGAGGNEVLLTDTKSFTIPTASTYSLNEFAKDVSRMPLISSARDNMIRGGKRRNPKQNKTQKRCVVMPIMLVPVIGTPLKKTKSLKKKGGTNVMYDFFLGPSSALSPLTSFGTVSGSVTASNTLTNDISSTTPQAWSQPIGTKFTATNPIYV